MANNTPKDAYMLILNSIDEGEYSPGDRMVESELADKFGVSRTPIREALQRLETQGLLSREGRSLFVSELDHDKQAQLYVVRSELEALAARLAAQHATIEEINVLRLMWESDLKLKDNPAALARSNRVFHRHIHRASHNYYLILQLELVHRSMALFAKSSLSVEGRASIALEEHGEIVKAIESRDGERAANAIRAHISKAFEMRLLHG